MSEENLKRTCNFIGLVHYIKIHEQIHLIVQNNVVICAESYLLIFEAILGTSVACNRGMTDEGKSTLFHHIQHHTVLFPCAQRDSALQDKAAHYLTKCSVY